MTILENTLLQETKTTLLKTNWENLSPSEIEFRRPTREKIHQRVDLLTRQIHKATHRYLDALESYARELNEITHLFQFQLEYDIEYFDYIKKQTEETHK